MSEKAIKTYEAFWPFYLGEHSLPSTRWWHFAGTTFALLNLISAVVFMAPSYIFSALISGYAFAWVSHFFIEKNKPATFKYPLWSLQADFVMWWKMVQGKMDAEVERVVRAQEEREKGATSESGEHAVSMSSEAVN